MGLLTPMIDRKGFLSVVATGFIVGLVGGGFFIAPVYNELPYVVGSAQQILGDSEAVYIETSTYINVTDLIKQIKEVDGVISVENEGIFLVTTNFSNERKKIIEEKIPIVDENFKSWYVDSAGVININITEGYDPNDAIKTLSDWLVYTADIQTKYSLVKLKINVESNKVNDFLSYLESKEIVISSVEGPVQGAVNSTKNNMPDSIVIVFFMGILGLMVTLFGIYFDETIKFLKELKENLKIKIKELKEKIKEWLEELRENLMEIIEKSK